MKLSLAFTLCRCLVLINPIFAHTWVETINLIGPDGSFQGTGFPRGFAGRQSGVSNDKINTYLLPPNGRSTDILSTDLMCKDTQVNQAQSAGFPRLSASPNDHVSLAYHENGHVTKFAGTDGKPQGRGIVFIYGTKNPSPKDTYLGIHKVWNEDGTGGDKRGKLLATRPFDDGRCFQPNDEKTAAVRAKALGFSSAAESPEVLCQSIVQLPSDAGTRGTYTLYWVWDWPTLDKAGNIFKNESYISCIDVNMVARSLSKSSQAVSTAQDSEDTGKENCDQSNKEINVKSKKTATKTVKEKRAIDDATIDKVTAEGEIFAEKLFLENGVTKKLTVKIANLGEADTKIVSVNISDIQKSTAQGAAMKELDSDQEGSEEATAQKADLEEADADAEDVDEVDGNSEQAAVAAEDVDEGVEDADGDSGQAAAAAATEDVDEGVEDADGDSGQAAAAAATEDVDEGVEDADPEKLNAKNFAVKKPLNTSNSGCKANIKDDITLGNIGSTKDDNIVFSATGYKIAKNGKDKANTFAVKDQLRSENQIVVDPESPFKIASDNLPKQAGSTTTQTKNKKISKKAPSLLSADRKLRREISATMGNVDLLASVLPIPRILRHKLSILGVDHLSTFGGFS